MRDLARRLLEQLLSQYGDIGFVTPDAFANSLRIVAELPADASPLHIETFMGQHAVIRVNAAPADVVGFNYHDGTDHVIETGRGRSIEERNITLPHEFGERLRQEINALLLERGLPILDWPDTAWDKMAVELVSPLALPAPRAEQRPGCAGPR